MRPRTFFRPRRRPRFTVLGALTLGLVTWTVCPAVARAEPLVLDGAVPEGGPDHFFLDFEVPEGTREIEVRHDDQSEANILDWGLNDPNGFRGWGGGNTEPAVVGELSASRSYLPGPLPAGTWRVVVGKAKVVASPATYRVEIDLRTTPTLPPATDRTPYAPASARVTGERYYAGDFHVHSRESGDASPTIQENVALAKSRGLDFIELSEHNTVSHDDLIPGIQANEPAFLLIPGIEYTTYQGHANAIGVTRWVDHKIGQPGITIDGAIEEVRAQGGVFSINHPALDLGDLCIGCAWKHQEDGSKLGGVEIATLGLSSGGLIFSRAAIAFWDGLLDRGYKIPPLGGSDDHRAGAPQASLPTTIGSPTTLVRARELSVAGILEGLRKGDTVVKLDGPDDPMIVFDVVTERGAEAPAPIARPGDTLGVRSVVLRAVVTHPAAGDTVRFVKNGVPMDPVPITGDPFVHEVLVTPTEGREDRYRAEVVRGNNSETVTAHVWLASDPSGPQASEGTKAEPAPVAEGDGCGCSTPGASRSGSLGALAVGVALSAASVRRLRRKR